MLDSQTFRALVESAPLVSIDIFPRKGDQVLLGKRTNKPAQGVFFSIGGRIYKNETIEVAMTRIASNELNMDLKSTPKFLGVFEHFYDDGVCENVSTHYVNLTYEYKIEEAFAELPVDQHSEYRWFSIEELLNSNQVHSYVKDCYRGRV